MILRNVLTIVLCALCISINALQSELPKFYNRSEEISIYISNLFRDSVYRNNTSLKNRSKLLEKLINDKLTDSSDKIQFISLVSDLGKKRRSPYFSILINMPYIDDETILLYLINCLSDADFKVQEYVYNTLLKYGRIDMLQRNSKLLIKNIYLFNKSYFENCPHMSKGICKEVISGENIELSMYPGRKLMSFLFLNEKEKKLILSNLNPQSDDEYLARLGVKKAEERLINSYNESSNFNDKERYSKKLGRAGTSECMKALISSLYTNVSAKRNMTRIDTTTHYIPFRIQIAHAIGLRHPDLNFLDSIYIMNTIPPGELLPVLWENNKGGKEAAIQLLRHIVNWGYKTYGIKPNGKEPNINEPIFRRGKVKFRIE